MLIHLRVNPSAPFISIIVPVLDEAELIAGFLRQLRELGPNLEIIVVDGRSSDETWSLAEPNADRVIMARRGRSSQMTHGRLKRTDGTGRPRFILRFSRSTSSAFRSGS